MFSLHDLFSNDSLHKAVSAFGNKYEDIFQEHPHMAMANRVNTAAPHGIAPSARNKDGAAVAGVVSTDIGYVAFKPTRLPAGQYHNGHLVSRATNEGGVHGIVIDTEQPNSTWTVVTCFVDDASLGIRPQFMVLARPDALFTSDPRPDKDECRGLTRVCRLRLPTGRVLVRGSATPAAVVSGMGDGFYPVQVERDGAGKVWRINVWFYGDD